VIYHSIYIYIYVEGYIGVNNTSSTLFKGKILDVWANVSSLGTLETFFLRDPNCFSCFIVGFNLNKFIQMIFK
jgi:hypothetical protein